MEEVKNTENAAQAETAAEPVKEEKAKKKGGFPKELVLSLVVIIAIVVAVIMIKKGTTVNLNKYATISATGYNAAGAASMKFDYDKFLEDYSKKIKFKSGSKEEKKLQESIWGSAANAMIQVAVSGSFDKASGLSNGDTVVYSWNYDAQAVKKAFGVTLKSKDMKLKVKGLEEVPVFDPFAGVELVYSGIGPNGYVELKNNSSDEIASKLRFDMDKTNGLSNGDVITVTLRDDGSQAPMQYFIKRYNAIPASTEKKFTVEGLGSYVGAAAEIPADTMTKMQSQAQDVINAYVANNWSKEAKMDNLTYIGNYFLKAKNNTYSGQNKVILVYRASASIKRDDDKENPIDDSFDYYIGVQYNDLIVLPDGMCSLDISSARMLNASFQKSYPGGWFGRNYNFQGYEDLDTMFNKNVTVNIANYEYENNVVDK